MSKPRSRKAAAASDAFTAGVDDDPQVTGDAGPIATADSASAGVSTPAPVDPGHGDAQPNAHQPVGSQDSHGHNPGIVMSDDEAIPEQFLRPRSSPTEEAAPAPATVTPLVSAGAVVAYEHRIRVLEAFHYPGVITGAPDWVDRNWLAYGDYDEKRKLPAGPALNVPTPRHPTGFALCRKGDYIVRQEIILAPGIPPAVQIEVWEKDDFERLFIPVQQPTEEAA